MNIVDGMIQELQYEAISARKTLERVPDAKLDYRPHPKSMTMGALASHIAESMSWAVPTLEEDTLDIPDGWKPWVGSSTAEIVAAFDKNLAGALAGMQGRSNDHLFATWRMKMGGKVVLEMPRVAVLRNMLINHLVHHRAQLGLYLRLNDLPVPSVYGPSADEAD